MRTSRREGSGDEHEGVEHGVASRYQIGLPGKRPGRSFACSWAGQVARGDSVIMKNGIVYRSQGAPDRDNTLVYISDGLKRVVVRDSKIERIEANNAFRTGEKFQAGSADESSTAGSRPREVISVRPARGTSAAAGRFGTSARGRTSRSAWSRRSSRSGRTSSGFGGSTGSGSAGRDQPGSARFGDHSLLGRVEQKNVEERERVVRFLMDVGWHAEAKQELDRLVQDFPTDRPEGAGGHRAAVHPPEPRRQKRRSEIDVSRKAQQYKRVAELLKTFKEKGNPTELQVEVREIERHDDQQHSGRQALAADLRKLADRLPRRRARILEGAGGRGPQGASTRHPTRSATGSPPGGRRGRSPE